MSFPIESSDLPLCITTTLTNAKALSAYSIFTGDDLDEAPSEFALEGSNDLEAWTELDYQVDVTWGSPGPRQFPVASTVAYKYYRLRLIDSTAGTVSIRAVQIFERFATVTKTATATSIDSQEHANWLAAEKAGVLLAADLEANCHDVWSATFSATATCPNGSATPTATGFALSFISPEDALAQATAEAISKLEDLIEMCSEGDNLLTLDIPELEQAERYPSVQVVEDLVGPVVKVSLVLHQVSHGNFGHLGILLESPDGTVVEILRAPGTAGAAGSSGPLPGVDIEFDDDAAGTLSGSLAFPGTYEFQPTTSPFSITYPLPAPQGPYGAVLSDFGGEDPNGLWKLWVVDFSPVGTGKFWGGWEVIIET
jgi:hypothetical protein